ncbi:penicillin-binding protein 1A [Bosea sp. (in: a-proteobacteria)]|uniref:penicillin-binding protein 1A n=1 Tax=Bosea sp. (in: a-proteobacteria) TaxID=1871050 RepID=UPI0027351800|nr:penicillin-binding protein 1A [Bosea sp. (in: a-proteobacteria)]MDP3257541.1 penicillin-binding protein 1A [Bosea sp. (in: a-proteobacteria)]
MRFILRLFGWLFAAGAIAFVIGAAVAGVLLWHYSQDLPDSAQLRNYEPPVMTRVHAGDGSLIAEFARERRLYLPIQAVPKLVIEAYLSAEDKNFYKHIGVDPEGLVRAAITNFRNRAAGRRPQGASTITQQVAKNFLVGSEQNIERKIREALVALRIESTYSKDKILELYLNEIYLGAPAPGQGSYGIAAAALNYFGKSVHELNLHEAAYLAALPKAPTDLHPFRNRERAIERRNYVIDRMVENGFVGREIGDQAKKQPLGVNPRTVSPNNIAAGYFAEEIRRELQDRYGEKKLLEGGLSVRATVDPKMQLMARKALVDGLVRFDEARGWRGAIQKLELSARDWGLAIGELPVLGDVAPWRLAVVLDVAGDSARLGLHPLRETSGHLKNDRDTVTLGAEGIKWTRRARVSQAVAVGDVVYVEPMENRPGQVRLRQLPEVNGAITVMDPFSGRVLAMVGGFSHDQSEFNRATQAMRQPGSSFKPFVYATALDNGYTPSSIVLDAPVEIDQGGGLGMWTPSNYDGKFTGPRTLRYGIQFSKNLMTVRLAKDVGMPLIAEYARRFGVYDDMLPVLSMSLGAGETTVMRMTAAYAMLVNGGKKIRPTLIDRIQDRWGATIFRHDQRICEGCNAEKWADQREPRLIDNRDQVLDPLTAYQMVSIMESVVNAGTATVVKSVGKPLAGKTGTTNDAKDVWFVGFSPDLAVGVYMGFDKPKSLGTSATAGQYAAPIFRDFMMAALKDKPATPFRVPAGIKLIRVDPKTGMRAGGEGGILEAFKPGTAPPDSYSVIGAAGDGMTPFSVAPGGGRAVGSGTGGLY